MNHHSDDPFYARLNFYVGLVLGIAMGVVSTYACMS
jgi:hypothetical protein